MEGTVTLAAATPYMAQETEQLTSGPQLVGHAQVLSQEAPKHLAQTTCAATTVQTSQETHLAGSAAGTHAAVLPGAGGATSGTTGTHGILHHQQHQI